MPIPVGTSQDEFQRRSYMVQAVYRQTHEGVWLAMSTPQSNASGGYGGYPDLWMVYTLPQAMAIDVLPFQYVPPEACIHREGFLGELEAEVRNKNLYPTMAFLLPKTLSGHVVSALGGVLPGYSDALQPV